jgi:hypothetical protein
MLSQFCLLLPQTEELKGTRDFELAACSLFFVRVKGGIFGDLDVDGSMVLKPILKIIGCKSVYWFHLALVNTVNIPVPF